MRSFALCLGLAALVALGGCATSKSGAVVWLLDAKAKHECEKGKAECDIDVGWLTGSVPEDIVAEANKTTTLRWTIPSWTAIWFDKKGIVFENKARDVLTCSDPKSDDKVVECTNNGKPDPDGYKYTIHLKWLGLPKPKDPYVWNQ